MVLILSIVCNSIYGWPWGNNFRRYWIAATHMVWWRRRFGEDSSKEFTETLNPCQIPIKFIAKCSKEEINFLNVNVILKEQATWSWLTYQTKWLLSFLDSTFVIHTTVRNVYSTARLWDITGFVLIRKNLINAATF